MAIVASMVVQRTERGDLMFLTSTTRHAQHALDVDAPALLLGAAMTELLVLCTGQRGALGHGGLHVRRPARRAGPASRCTS